MKKLSKFKAILRVSLLSLSVILMTGIDSFSAENGKSKKKNDIPKPIVDETPINPKSVSKEDMENSDSEDSTDTSSNELKTKKKKKK